jgi:hypothetical protein
MRDDEVDVVSLFAVGTGATGDLIGADAGVLTLVFESITSLGMSICSSSSGV